jgi:3-oxoacyl-[acyl-carrier protein] reductase
MNLGLKGKIVLVTGSSRGIGKEIALAFAREGANLVIHYKSSAEGAEESVNRARELGVEALALQADIADSGHVARMFEKIKEHYSTLDVLVNNASNVLGGPTVSFPDKAWRSQMSVCLDGTFFCSREALKIMLEKRAGKIINISSVSGLGAFNETAAYSAAKAGVIGFTRALAKEVIPMGVYVNAVAPGFIDSPLIADFVNSEQGNKFLDIAVPLGRFGKMSEIAAVTVFLASTHADYFVGEVLSPSGGLVTGPNATVTVVKKK